MAEIFLDELLRTSNSVQSDSQDRDCVICLQRTGTMSRETGLIELQLRLPCGHVVGSGCNVVWLKANNSCPICRGEFFPAQPPPVLEDGMMEGQEEEDQEEEEEDEYEDEGEVAERLRMLERVCQDHCFQLDLFGQTVRTAELIIRNLLRLYPFSQAVSHMYEHSAGRLVALGIYITSCLADNPRSPREICMVQDVNGDRIHDRYGVNGDLIRYTYSTIHDRREGLIDDRVRESLEVRQVVWPTYDLSVMSDNQIECGRDLPRTKMRCVIDCAVLHVPSPIDELSQHIAANLIRTGFSYPENSRHVSREEISAVSIYMASHLVGRPISRREIQDIMGGGKYPDIRSTYRIVRNECNQLVCEAFRETLNVQLNWETLEADVREESDDGRHEDSEDDDAMEEDRSRGEGDTTQGGVTGNVSATQSHAQHTVDLCNHYCNRIALAEHDRITLLARGLGERFATFEAYVGRCPKSIAAACIYIACCTTENTISYPTLVAATGVTITSYHATHLMMALDLLHDRISVQDIADSVDVNVQHLMQVPQHVYDPA